MADACVFQKVDVRRFPSTGSGDDVAYWRGFRIRSARQTGAIAWLDFSPVHPNALAATSGTRVVLYGENLQSEKALSKFRDLAHCGSFRQDGNLIVAGTEEGTVKVKFFPQWHTCSMLLQVFNMADRSVLRQFEGHKRAVHVSHFSSSLVHVLSGSDDATVRWWDLSEGKQLARFDGHRDYVRAGMQSPVSQDIWATGGYDHVCRIWDIRQRTSCLELDHGAPIESVTFLPSGTLLVTAGGPYLCVWDVLSTGRMLRKLETHHKTITSVNVLQRFRESGDGLRLVSASLDQHVKIYDLTEFKVVHDARYKNPILSFASTPDGRTYAVGMSNGTIVLRDNRHKQMHQPEIANSDVSNTIQEKKPKLSGFNNLLRKFRPVFLRGNCGTWMLLDIRMPWIWC